MVLLHSLMRAEVEVGVRLRRLPEVHKIPWPIHRVTGQGTERSELVLYGMDQISGK